MICSKCSAKTFGELSRWSLTPAALWGFTKCSVNGQNFAGGQNVIKMKVNNNNKKGKANSAFRASLPGPDSVECSCPFSFDRQLKMKSMPQSKSKPSPRLASRIHPLRMHPSGRTYLVYFCLPVGILLSFLLWEKNIQAYTYRERKLKQFRKMV